MARLLRALVLLTLATATAYAATATAFAAPAPPAIEEPALLEPVAPVYPPAQQARGVRATVVVEIDLDTEGKVSKAQVVESAGPDFDTAALDAAKRLRFSPAMQGGKPVPVRLRYRFDFTPPVLLDRRAAAGSQGRFDRRGPEDFVAGTVSLRGEVTERGTGRPVPGALVTVPAHKSETVTDGDGRFRFGPLPAGTWDLYLPGAEHKPLRTKVTIVAGKTAEVALRAERKSYTLYQATAEAPPEAGQMSRRTLGAEEIQRIPGTAGDAFKVVQNLPGVARGTAGSGLLVVRGSAPLDSFITVEGVRIPLIYHFGAIYSVINTDLLEAIDFYPGGYPVKWGRYTGGVVNARLKAPPAQDDHWHGYLESNVFHTGFLLEGPVGTGTHLALAARRSYIDVVLDTVVPEQWLPFTLSPRYYDWQAKLNHRVGPKTDLTLMLLGSDDGLSAVVKTPPPGFPTAHGEVETRTNFSTLIGVLRHRGDGWTATTTLGATLGLANASLGDLLRFDLVGREYTLRQDFTIGDGPIVLRPGLDLFCNPFDAEIYAPRFSTTGERGTAGTSSVDTGRPLAIEQAGFFAVPGAYFDAVWKPSKALEIVPGFRADFFVGDSGGSTFTPRLNVRWRQSDQLLWKGALGSTSQRPQPNEVAKGFGNPDLQPVRGYEAAFGAEYEISEALDLDVQVFGKLLDDVVAFRPSVLPQPPENSGTGRVVGLELLARHQPVGRFFGWIAYTLQRATRVDYPGATERLFGWDQTHILTALGSYKLDGNWEVGARFRLVTGNPITPRVTAVYNEKSDNYMGVPSANLHSDRLPAFHQLDVRVDKKWVFDTWLLSAYLDVQNVYNHGNAEAVQHNYDSTAVQYRTGLPIIPSLGIRGEF